MKNIKKYKYFDSKKIKIFLESTWKFGCEFCFKISISFRTKGSDYDDQFIEVGDFINNRDWFKLREDAEIVAFDIAKKIEKLVSNEIKWIQFDDVKFIDGKMYAVKSKSEKIEIALVIFEERTEMFKSLNDRLFYDIELVADFEFS